MILELHLPSISIVSSFKFIIHIIFQWYNFSGLFFFCLDLLTEKNFQICRKLNLLTFCLRHCNCELFEGISKKFMQPFNSSLLLILVISFLVSTKIVLCLHTPGLSCIYPLFLALHSPLFSWDFGWSFCSTLQEKRCSCDITCVSVAVANAKTAGQRVGREIPVHQQIASLPFNCGNIMTGDYNGGKLLTLWLTGSQGEIGRLQANFVEKSCLVGIF